ncbi:MAG: bifunctional nuclease family protein [Kiritimatiellae bacterium]|nr:bifunctional nuclease family protein [Kiritimatiellia bacterium]
MIPVRVNQMFLSNMGPVVLLSGVEDKRSVPIFIGTAEAQSIAISLGQIEVPRPLTHDLLKNLLDFFECRLMRMEIADINDGTFYANLILEKDGNEMRIDCRPSDGIALSLRCDVPIYIYKKVMDEVGRVFSAEELGAAKSVKKTGNAKPNKELSHVKQLKNDLAQAVKEEKYEDAAKIRDEIKHFEQTHTHN